MKIRPTVLTFSATDLSNFLGCSHRALLDRLAQSGGPKPPQYDDPGLEVLWQRGLEHEAKFEAALVAEGLDVGRIAAPVGEIDRAEYWKQFTESTLEALRSGREVVVQGGLWDGVWKGKPDFLRRVGSAPPPAMWAYDVVDTKLAREAKAGALLQILLYADLLTRVHGAAPPEIHLALGGPNARTESFRVSDYAAYFRSIRDRFVGFHEQEEDVLVGPDPVEHCGICAWKSRCVEERKAVDHLSLVAGISARQRRALVERGIHTLEALAKVATSPLSPPLHGVNAKSLDRVCQQARVQLQGRLLGEPCYELLPVEPGQGLATLPAPSPGDLFFDLEGNPYAFTHGIEYLFGYTDADGEYEARWALTREEEKRAFEAFIDMVMERLERYPDLHVYHYAPYEPTALKRLMSFHGTREAEVDRLLRGGVLVDLYRVVRQGVRASVESYSIKKMEPFYGLSRDVELRSASLALARFDAWLEMGMFDEGNAHLRNTVEGYNRDDCVSTLRLRNWLETLRLEAEEQSGTPLPRPSAPEPNASEQEEERQADIAARMEALTAGVPADPEERSPDQQARWMLAQMLEFHRREKKSTWWEYFRCMELGEEEAIEDHAALGGLEYVGVVAVEKRSQIHRYRFPRQDHAVRPGDVRDPATGKSPGTVVAIDPVAGTIDLKRAKPVPEPRTLVPYDMVQDRVLRESICRLADAAIANGLDRCSFRAGADLLVRRPPVVSRGPGDRLCLDGETPLDAACRLAIEMGAGVLPIQGPPGAGKTHTAAEMIVTAIAAGKRVGVTANSHKVIANLLSAVCRAATRRGVSLRGIQKADGGQWCGEPCIRAAGSPGDVVAALDPSAEERVDLAAGTAWLWAREDMIGTVDLLIIDEAGQFSLANALAVSPATDVLVLLGDPRQLEQPKQGVHPLGSDPSALDHLLGGEVTIADDRGLFLEETWRMHPSICDFTSEMFYAGRLEAKAGLDNQSLVSSGEYAGNGLRFVPVTHSDNQNESPEEVEVVAGIVESLRQGCSWIDAEGAERHLGLSDILVVAPYNAQVAALQERLPPGARVGTVDKFQGQEAPVVIYSLTSSSAADAPRGMEFLYNPNRLNVATSRARCLAIVVGSPTLFTPECRTPQQMRLANAFCRLRELAQSCAPAAVQG